VAVAAVEVAAIAEAAEVAEAPGVAAAVVYREFLSPGYRGYGRKSNALK